MSEERTVAAAMPTAAALLDQLNALLPEGWEAALVLIDRDNPKAIVAVGNIPVETLIGSLRETQVDPGPTFDVNASDGLIKPRLI